MSDNSRGSTFLEDYADSLVRHEGITDYGKLYLQGYDGTVPEKF